jgi:hypothetical protein
MNKQFLLTTVVAFLAACPATAQVQWSSAVGGNDHYYLAVVVPSGLTWAQADAAATAAGGYLATLTTRAENDFVYALVDSPAFWQFEGFNTQGPYLGGFQAGGPEPAGGWQWVSGENWSFTNWAANQPDNNAGNEGFLQFLGPGNARANSWNDVSAGASFSRGYVIEFNSLSSASAPEPTTLALIALLALGAVGLPARRRKINPR